MGLQSEERCRKLVGRPKVRLQLSQKLWAGMLTVSYMQPEMQLDPLLSSSQGGQLAFPMLSLDLP